MGFHSHSVYRYGTSVAALYAAAGGAATVGGELLAGETDAMGIDFTYHTDIGKQHYISDLTTPANNYNSYPQGKLTYTSPSVKLCRQSDGVWRYANHNLAIRSQTIDNASIGKTACSVTADSTTAPDGTSTVDTLVEDGSNGQHFLQWGGNPSGFAGQFSAFVKAKDRTWIIVESDGGSTYFDVGNGVLGTNGAGGTITSVGSGWYLCKITNVTSNCYIRMATANNVGSYAGDGSSGIYLWGVQSKRTPVNDAGGFTYATGYLVTGASAVYDLPYEWNAALASQGILIEEARTNLALRSQEFGTTWTVDNASISSNATTAPDGTTTADKLVENSGNIHHRVYQAVVGTAAAMTRSVYAKAAGRNFLEISCDDDAAPTNNKAWFNLSNGTLGTVQSGVTASIVDAGNGWYRCSATFTAGTGTNQYIAFFCNAADNTESYQGNGSDGIYLWGAQHETGAFPTSPIHTIAATVTRVVDNISMLTSVMPVAASTGSMIAYFNPKAVLNTAGTNQYAVSRYNSSGPQDFVVLQIDTTGVLNVLSQTGGSSSYTANHGSAVAGTDYKFGISFQVTDFASTVNGASPTLQASGSAPSVATTFSIGNRPSDVARAFNGYIKQITYIKTAISDANLQTRTT